MTIEMLYLTIEWNDYWMSLSLYVLYSTIPFYHNGFPPKSTVLLLSPAPPLFCLPRSLFSAANRQLAIARALSSRPHKH